MLDATWGGADPRAYHASSVLLHALGSALLLLALERLTARPWRSALVAALFGLHPLHVQSVAWIAERKDVLSGVFWFLTLLAYVGYVRRKSRWWYLVVAVTFAVGLMAKPMLVSLPIILLLLDYWPLRRLRAEPSRSTFRSAAKLLSEKIPLFALSAGSCAITIAAQARGGAIADMDRFPFAVRAANAALSYAIYAVKTVWPSGLGILYPHPGLGVSYAMAYLAGAAILAVTAVTLRLARTAPYLPVGWLWYLLTLVPVIGLVQVGSQARADRYTYIPLIGLFIVAAWGMPQVADRLFARRRRAGSRRQVRSGSAPRIEPSRAGTVLLAAAALAALAALAGRSWIELGYWRSRLTLFERLAVVQPGSATAHNTVGVALLEAGETDRAVEHLRRAVQLDPQRSGPRTNLAAALEARGLPEEAIEQLRVVMQIEQGSPESRRHLAEALLRAGRAEEAANQYALVLEADPADPGARAGLAASLLQLGLVDVAIEHGREAVRLDPSNPGARKVLGAALLSRGNLDGARAELEESISLKPDSAESRANLAAVLLRLGDLDGAIDQCRRALSLSPEQATAHANLGLALMRRGSMREAATSLEKAVSLRPDNAMLHASLGEALLRLDRLDFALEHLRTAIRLDPSYSDARLHLAEALAASGDRPAAEEEIRILLRDHPSHEAAKRALEALRGVR